MDTETTYIPEDAELPGEHWKKLGRRPGEALEPFWDFTRKLEDEFRQDTSKRHPQISCEDVESVVAIRMHHAFLTRRAEFEARLPRAPSPPESATSTEPEPPADDLNPQSLADVVKWKL